ncbi:hypothetical protein [Actinoplanes sp. L3-i22]|uniref:hypothetical protein n=1 Tax=Actinoplanes sp. L3-i22 TaxID=2836373 RepID=UPI001C7859DB|nr:hypothetical protein [Actinoplanes sp. L3-i22]BCY09366.1 hypothetical protein L3i22_044540 [Actinoplanes sp. L3-i22]
MTSATTAPAMLPVSVSAQALRAAAGMPEPSAAPPPDGSELPILQQESYQMQATLAVKLGFPIATVSAADKVIAMLYGITRYTDVVDNGHTDRYGVAIRVLLEIYNEDVDADLTLPVVAAKAQLGAVSATAQLLVHGYVGDLAAELPSWQSFDVNSYAEYRKAISAVQRQVFRDVANIRPVLLSSTIAASLWTAGDGPARAGHQTRHALQGRLNPFRLRRAGKPGDDDYSPAESPAGQPTT